MIGETVTVKTPSWGKDGGNNAVITGWTSQTVKDVIVGPGPRSDVVESNRPLGVQVRFNLHFPKTFSGSLEHCRITVRGSDYSVIGSPQPYTLENTPTRWWMPVEVVDIHG